MAAFIRRHASTVVVAMVTAAVTAGGPAVAAAYDAMNARKVDGRDAVGAGASASDRAGNLVATNSAGRLPNNIISKAPDAQELDGNDSTAFAPASHLHDSRYVKTSAHTTSAHDSLGIDAATVDGKNAADMTYEAGSGLSMVDNVFSVTGAPWSGLTGIPSGIADGDDVDGGTAANVACTLCVHASDLAGSDNPMTFQVGAVTSEKIADATIQERDLNIGHTLDVLVNPESVAAVTRATHRILLPALHAGDIVTVSPPAALNDDLLFVGHRVGDGYVDVYLYNNSQAGIDDDQTTWRIQYIDLTTSP